ncbi:MAG: outer membrane beta-barrel protein [Prevotellaceae bacterium]|nr:outer membrane beta-barrel protein [Prevotellaceae bacterium]
MRKTIIILSLLCLQALTAGAKGITASFRGVPLSEALASIASQQKEYRVQFIFSDLEEFSVSADIVSSGVVEAIRELTGNLPIRVTAQGKDIFVDRLLDEGGNISSRLIDKKGQAVSYASVALLNPSDSTVLNGMITGDEGVFSLPCTSDSLLVRISCIGFSTVYLPASSGNLGDIRLVHDVMMMEQLEVNASNIVHLQDKDVIYITREMRKGSYNTGELLGKVPGMVHNRLTDELRYQGQKNILLLVDSLEYDASYIKNLHHLRFDKIEVIPNPKGKYAGYDVVINLHRKEKYQGWENNGSGVVVLYPGDRNMIDNPLGHSDWWQAWTYTHNKWNFYAYYYGNFSQESLDYLSTTQYLLNNYTEEVITNHDGTRNNTWHERVHQVTAATDYQFDQHNSISLSYQYQWSDKDTRQRQTMVRTDLEGVVEDTINSYSFSTDKWHRHQLAAFYRGGKGVWNYTTSLNYNRMDANTTYYLGKTSGYETTDNRWSRMDHTFGKVEVNRRFLNDKIYWALGYDDLWKHYKQQRAETQESLTDYTLKQSTVWTYGSYNVTEKASLSVLASITTNKTKGDGANDHYLSWRGDLTYYQKMKAEQWMRLNYSCNVSNPELSQVTSYGQFSDSLSWSGGNPLLRSSVKHWARLQYHFLKYLTISVEDTYQPRTFSNITTLQYGILQSGAEGYYAAIMPQNAKWNETTISLDFTKQIKQLNLAANISFGRNSGKYEDYKHTGNGCIWDINADYDIERWALTPSIEYQGGIEPTAWAQGSRRNKVDILWLMMTKYCCKRRLQITLVYAPPMHFTDGKNISYTDTPATYINALNPSYNKQMNNHFELYIKYNIGGGKSVRKYNREMSDEK